MEVSLADGRCVIGFVQNETPDFEGDISLWPQLSGHRHPKTQEIVITAEYENADDDFRVVLLVDETTSVSHFDPASPYIKWEIPGLTVTT